MPVTIRHIKGGELPPSLQNKFNVTPQQLLTVTVKVEEKDKEEYDIENLGDTLIQGLEEITECKKNGIEMSDARDLLNSL